ncbi:MAG: glutamate racemase [Sphingomonadales bacterium]|nr:glutamate racemase [Sphingomonadales bacterium]
MNPINKSQPDLYTKSDGQIPPAPAAGPIGVFDSGLGGLTVLRHLTRRQPLFDYLYLGDQARVPYGTRSFETVLRYTREGVSELFSRGCALVILACNTASAKALRSLQQEWLPTVAPDRKILGVLRPSTEEAGNFTRSGHLGILATPGTVISNSYPIEIGHFFPELTVTQHACPLWVPLVEVGELDSDGTRYFVDRDLRRLFDADPRIDAVLLACTHYPLLIDVIRRHAPNGVSIIEQGPLIAEKLNTYLERHPEIRSRCTTAGRVRYLTTDKREGFCEKASLFGMHIDPNQVEEVHHFL